MPAVTSSRDVIVARSEIRNNHITWERLLNSRFLARLEADTPMKLIQFIEFTGINRYITARMV